jgi:hypothetical protein
LYCEQAEDGNGAQHDDASYDVVIHGLC